MEILVFSGVRGHPYEIAMLLWYLTEMPQKEDLRFSQAPVSSVPGWLSLGIIYSQVWWGSRGLPGLVQGRAKQPTSFSMQKHLQTFVCRKEYFLSRKKISTLIFHPFQDAFTADYRQTKGRCLWSQIVWSDIAQWNHMVPPVILIIHFC